MECLVKWAGHSMLHLKMNSRLTVMWLLDFSFSFFFFCTHLHSSWDTWHQALGKRLPLWYVTAQGFLLLESYSEIHHYFVQKSVTTLFGRQFLCVWHLCSLHPGVFRPFDFLCMCLEEPISWTYFLTALDQFFKWAGTQLHHFSILPPQCYGTFSPIWCLPDPFMVLRPVYSAC